MPQGLRWQELLPTVIAVAGVLVLTWVALWLSTRAIRRLADRITEESVSQLVESGHQVFALYQSKLLRLGFRRRIVP